MTRQKVIDRFIAYAKIHTASAHDAQQFPSTDRQREFAARLAAELRQLGLEEVNCNADAYVTATLPANCDSPTVVGFIAHIDTSPDFNGHNVNPKTVHYVGGDIELGNGRRLSPTQFPELTAYCGQDIITTDGATLLGADDKAGIAEIITAMEYLLANPHIKHGKIRIAFTPDEEVGNGASRFDVATFGAHFAYTIDGGGIGELEFENFNAATAKITLHGRSVHPGYAKNIMVNAILLATEINAMLPPEQRPEHTEGYEGFFHCVALNGTVEHAELTYIIRDHNRNAFEKRKELITNICSFINKKYDYPAADLVIDDVYYNMREKIEPVYQIVELAEKAMRQAGIEPVIKPIRGGTDGAGLSYKGLPCPNLFTGGHNFHGPFEFIPIQSMCMAVDVIVKIAENAKDIRL
ncbi:MAG: peptidase T [Bacteroidales bacterium]|jgi:tripeptide aminopeptidase|nr:peptidase T [Bacteroidales bacterium]